MPVAVAGIAAVVVGAGLLPDSGTATRDQPERSTGDTILHQEAALAPAVLPLVPVTPVGYRVAGVVQSSGDARRRSTAGPPAVGHPPGHRAARLVGGDHRRRTTGWPTTAPATGASPCPPASPSSTPSPTATSASPARSPAAARRDRLVRGQPGDARRAARQPALRRRHAAQLATPASAACSSRSPTTTARRCRRAPRSPCQLRRGGHPGPTSATGSRSPVGPSAWTTTRRRAGSSSAGAAT